MSYMRPESLHDAGLSYCANGWPVFCVRLSQWPIVGNNGYMRAFTRVVKVLQDGPTPRENSQTVCQTTPYNSSWCPALYGFPLPCLSWHYCQKWLSLSGAVPRRRGLMNQWWICFVLTQDDHCVHIWQHQGESINPAVVVERHTCYSWHLGAMSHGV